MKIRYLFPNRFKIIGWIILVPSTIAGILLLLDTPLFLLETDVFALFGGDFFADSKPFMIVKDDITNEAAATLMVIGGILAAFSKKRMKMNILLKLGLTRC